MVAINDEGVVEMSGIGTCLWFDREAEEAANFYVKLFPYSHIGEVNRYPEGTMGEPGSVLTVSFVLDGRNFTAWNGGPAGEGRTGQTGQMGLACRRFSFWQTYLCHPQQLL